MPNPRTITTNIGSKGQLWSNYKELDDKIQQTKVIGTNLVSLVPSHQQSNLLRVLVFQQLDFTRSPFLPFSSRFIESKQL